MALRATHFYVETIPHAKVLSFAVSVRPNSSSRLQVGISNSDAREMWSINEELPRRGEGIKAHKLKGDITAHGSGIWRCDE